MKISSNKGSKLSRRDFLKASTLAPFLLASSSAMASDNGLSASSSKKRAKIVIVGAGIGGLDSASRLRRSAPNAKITLIAPNAISLYQSGAVFTSVGLYTQADNRVKTSDLLLDGIEWIKSSVSSFEPDKNRVVISNGKSIEYDVLVVATGLKHDFNWIDGLSRESIGDNGVTSVYLNDTLKGEAKGGFLTLQWLETIASKAQNSKVNLLFAIPKGDIQAENASLDILLLGLDMLRGKGSSAGIDVSNNIQITLVAGNDRLIASEEFDKAVKKLLGKIKNLKVLTGSELKSIDIESKTATVSNKDGKKSLKWDFLHIAPKIKAIDEVANSPLALNSGEREGFIDINPNTLQHKTYKNVFALGDSVALSSKSGAGARDMAITIQDNVANFLDSRKLSAKYNGYTASPLRVAFGKEMLIEYDRNGANPTFPLNPTIPRWIYWEIDVHLMRWIYFNLILRGLL